MKLALAALALVACGGTNITIGDPPPEGSRDPAPATFDSASPADDAVALVDSGGTVDAHDSDGGDASATDASDGGSPDADPTYDACAALACSRAGACGVQPSTCNGRAVDCGDCNWENFPFGTAPERDGYCNDQATRPATCGHACSQIYDHGDPTCGALDHSFGSCGAPTNESATTKIYTWDPATKTKTYRAGGTLGCAWHVDRWCCP